MWIVGFSMFILGLVFVIVAPINRRKNARCSAQTEGVLRDILGKRSSRSSAGHMYIYSYIVNGIEYQTKSTICSPQIRKVGDSCTIWYNPKKPEDAQPFRYESAKVYNIILILGIVMVLLGIVLTVAGAAL